MDQIIIKKISVKRFNALAGHSRSAAASYVSKELEWYANSTESVLGVLLLDTIDDDYAAVVMGRDENNRFRAIEVESSFPLKYDASQWLERTMKWFAATGKRIFPQGDPQKGINLFAPVIPIERQHPYFAKLSKEIAFLPARSIITEMMPYFIDIDGNFVEQFQSTGFDSRLWELYLNSYFVEEQLFIERNHHAPDFLVKKYGKAVAIEAVTVGRKTSNPPRYFRTIDANYDAPISESAEDAMSIKFGSPLFSKLQKKYWELPHVRGNPLVIAIADFHDDQSMLWSSTALINYLYGVRHKFYHDNHGQLIITPEVIEKHNDGEKTIPSGFFFQPDAEHISAVLFSASGTISKFNRIGKQSGFGDHRVIMIRQGTCHDHDPNATVPKLFRYLVDESSSETWGEGLSMFHNPNTQNPLPKELFPSIAHHRFDEGQIVSFLPEFHPYGSVTINIKLGSK